MTYSNFSEQISKKPGGVILLEGRRSITEADAAQARDLGSRLARCFPSLRFRSGNAQGSDEAFSEGVASIDASRLQIVAPYASHRKAARYSDATYDSPESLTRDQEEDIVHTTIQATPRNKGLVEKRGRKGAIGAKAAYLIRDTMKVVGHSSEFPTPVFALFYVDLNDPLAGGTGHTVRVCQHEQVPYVFQDSWMQWIS